MANFQQRLQKALEEVSRTFEHGLSSELIAELESYKPAFVGSATDDACLRAWKSIEKVALIFLVIFTLFNDKKYYIASA